MKEKFKIFKNLKTFFTNLGFSCRGSHVAIILKYERQRKATPVLVLGFCLRNKGLHLGPSPYLFTYLSTNISLCIYWQICVRAIKRRPIVGPMSCPHARDIVTVHKHHTLYTASHHISCHTTNTTALQNDDELLMWWVTSDRRRDVAREKNSRDCTAHTLLLSIHDRFQPAAAINASWACTSAITSLLLITKCCCDAQNAKYITSVTAIVLYAGNSKRKSTES